MLFTRRDKEAEGLDIGYEEFLWSSHQGLWQKDRRIEIQRRVIDADVNGILKIRGSYVGITTFNIPMRRSKNLLENPKVIFGKSRGHRSYNKAKPHRTFVRKLSVGKFIGLWTKKGFTFYYVFSSWSAHIEILLRRKLRELKNTLGARADPDISSHARAILSRT